MIGYIAGKVIEKTTGELWVDVRDVGYRVTVGNDFFSQAVKGENVELFVHTHVREDALSLYGFSSRPELELFELVISVSGVGPKIGLAVVGNNSVEAVLKAVRDADVQFFQATPGIGKKGAQRIIVDLKGKLPVMKELDLADVEDDAVLDALMQFGFSRQEVELSLSKLEDGLSEEERISQALKALGGR